MLRAALGPFGMLAFVVATARAEPILYATAATTGEVTSYCVGQGGGLEPDPRQRITTNGNAPSRVITHQMAGGQFLYVAENDRVEVFQIGEGGGLTRMGRIPARPLPDNPRSGLIGMNPHDLFIAEAPDGSGPVLYVPQRAYDRVAAFPLDPATGLSTVPTGVCTGGSQNGASCTPSDREGAAGQPPAPDACAEGGGACTPISDQTGASCVLGPVPSEWEDMEVANQLVYISRAVNRGEVFAYQLAPDGNFADGEVVVTQTIGTEVNPTQCADERCDQNGKAYVVPSADCTAGIVLTDVDGQPITRAPTDQNPDPPPLTVRGQIEPYARRRRLNGAGSLILMDDIMYVSERFRRAISALELCPAGGEPVVCPAPSGNKGEPCTCPDANEDGVPDVDDLCPPFGFSVDAKFNKDGMCTARFRQRRLARNGGRTKSDIRYNAMALARGINATTILGAQFLDGRIDGYRLKDDGRLPRSPTRRTSDNFRTSPFRMFLYRPADVRPEESAGVLYVGAGDVNRVQAYRLDRNGLPRDRSPFSETATLDDTFPNDVTVAELPGPCR